MTTQIEDKPLYLGHRARLRKRFLTDEGASMPDYELLELLLTMAIPRRDVKPLAKKLIILFGNLAGVINAPIDVLYEKANLSSNAVTLLKLISTCFLRISSDSFSDDSEDGIYSNLVLNWDVFEDYCHQLMGYKEIEEFRVFFLDINYKYKGNTLISTGTIAETKVYPREIVRSAIKKKASYVILAHNHPSGSCAPSGDDKDITKKMVEALSLMDVKVFDHLIVTRNKIFSFKGAGLLICDDKRCECTY
mgnify:CR=1 FL=1